MVIYRGDPDGPTMTDADWDKADALEGSRRSPHKAWILTDRDVWHPNPFYKGPHVPHPEWG